MADDWLVIFHNSRLVKLAGLNFNDFYKNRNPEAIKLWIGLYYFLKGENQKDFIEKLSEPLDIFTKLLKTIVQHQHSK